MTSAMGESGIRTASKKEISRGLFFSFEKKSLKTISFLGSKIFCTKAFLVKFSWKAEMQR
jgi:hypothetical protein